MKKPTLVSRNMLKHRMWRQLSAHPGIRIYAYYAFRLCMQCQFLFIRYAFCNTKIVVALGRQEVSKAVLGLRTFKGWDSVSAFAAIEKVRPLRLLPSKNEFQVMFQNLGEMACICYVRDEERQSGSQLVPVRGVLLPKRWGRNTSTTTLSRLPTPSLQESQLPDRTHQQLGSRSGCQQVHSRKWRERSTAGYSMDE